MTPIKQDITAATMICILGATATGKTRLAVAMAKRFNGEIISADSRQVYRGLDIGSGKDLNEYQGTPYHLIDVVDPDHEFNLFEFIKHFNASYSDIAERGKLPFLVGGTGMYLDAVLSRYELTVADTIRSQHPEWHQMSTEELREQLLSFDSGLHNTTDLVERDRILRAMELAAAARQGLPTLSAPEIKTLTIGINMPREHVKQRITKRLKSRLANGLIEEVERLKCEGMTWEQFNFLGLEYRYVADYLQGKLNYNDMYQKLNSAIHLFAKQQDKWFRKLQKKGHAITWLPADDRLAAEAGAHIESFLINTRA